MMVYPLDFNSKNIVKVAYRYLQFPFYSTFIFIELLLKKHAKTRAVQFSRDQRWVLHCCEKQTAEGWKLPTSECYIVVQVVPLLAQSDHQHQYPDYPRERQVPYSFLAVVLAWRLGVLAGYVL